MRRSELKLAALFSPSVCSSSSVLWGGPSRPGVVGLAGSSSCPRRGGRERAQGSMLRQILSDSEPSRVSEFVSHTPAEGAHLPRLPPLLHAGLEDVVVQDRRAVRHNRLGVAPGPGPFRQVAGGPDRFPLRGRRDARVGSYGVHVSLAPPVLRRLPRAGLAPRLAHGRGAL